MAVRGFGFPTAGAQRPAQPSAPAMEGNQFTEALREPEVQAALIQFGINMLQPTYSGFGGQVGKSLGQAGAAAGRAASQRQERQVQGRQEERRDERLDLARRRTRVAEQGEKRRSKGGRSASSLFTKPKSYQQFLSDLAKERSEWEFLNTDEGRSPEQIMTDQAFQQEALQLWRQTSGIGTVGEAAPQAQGEAQEPTGGIARPQSQEEFEQLPTGTLFVNPADGRVMRKR